MTLIGKIAKPASVTVYSVLVLSILLCRTALSDPLSQSPISSQSQTAKQPSIDVTPDQSLGGSTKTTPSQSSDQAKETTPRQDSAQPKETAPSQSSIHSNEPIPIPTSSDSAEPDPNQTFVRFIEAVSGKPATEEIRNLVQGVVSLQRKGESVELTKSDSSKVLVGSDTEFGASVVRDLSEAKDKLSAKFGPEVGTLVDEFVGVTANGSHIDVIRNGPEVEDLDLSERKIKKQLPLRRVRLSKISVDLVQVDGHPALKNITGIEVVPNAGFEIPIILKEFSRSQNQDGNDVLIFGIRNPLSLFKPFRKLFGIKDTIPFTWTVKKKESKEIGAKESPGYKE